VGSLGVVVLLPGLDNGSRVRQAAERVEIEARAGSAKSRSVGFSSVLRRDSPLQTSAKSSASAMLPTTAGKRSMAA
jgi:hypothetical protein